MDSDSSFVVKILSLMANQPAPPNVSPRKEGLIKGLLTIGFP